MKLILLLCLLASPTLHASSSWSGGGGGVTKYASVAAFPTGANGDLAVALDTAILYMNAAGVWGAIGSGAGSGNVVGPLSSTSGNLASYGDTSGQVIADSGVAAANLCLLTGNQTVAGIKTLSSAPILSALTASKPVFTDGSKALTNTGTVPVANGGTNSTTSLNNNRVMQSSGGAIVEASAITASRALASDSNGIPVAATTTATELGYVNGVTSAIQTQLGTKLPTTGVGLVEQFTGFVETPTDKTYVLDQSASFAYTINTIIVQTASGTLTLAAKINGTNVTGISAVSVSSTPATGTASAANSVSIGDRVTLVVSSSSSPADLSFTLKYTR